MKVFITNTFKRNAKKLHRNQIIKLEEAIKQIKKNPTMGELKVGDLVEIRVFKFHLLHQLILLAYTFDEEDDELILLSFAPHENFYENLKKHIKN